MQVGELASGLGASPFKMAASLVNSLVDARHISPLTAGAAVEAGRVLGSAFVDDPVMRYYFEGDEDRADPVRKTMTLAVRLTLRYGTAFRLDCGGRLAGVALVLPPDVRDFPLSAVIASVLGTPSLWRPRALIRHFGVTASIDAHRPAFACWTLLSIGIAPGSQHVGHGAGFLQHVMQRVAAGAPLCLETDNERNLPLYFRHGFEVTSEFVAHHGKGPRTWAMLCPEGR